MTDNGHTDDPQEDKPLLDYWGSERSDLKLLDRALKEGWPITPEMRQMIVDRTSKVARRSTQARNIIGAARVLVQMDMANISRERMALDRTPQSAQHVHYEYHKHDEMTEEEYHRRTAPLVENASENGHNKTSGRPPSNGHSG